MRAWRINQLGHPSEALKLEDIDDPSPGPGELLVRIEAVNVNFADILLCQGIYQDRPGVPFTPGLEAVGTVEAVGGGDQPSGAAVGDRVAGMAALPSGGYAEKALIRSSGALVIPDDLPAEEATVLYSTYQTAHVGLHHRARLSEGETLLVHGGAGGVGSAAIQLGVAAGARVIATAGGSTKVGICRDLGADHALDHRSTDVYAAVKELTDGRGVDVAFDPVGGEIGELTRRLMAWEGRLIVVGFAAGDIPSYPANHVLVKNYSILGLHWGAYAANDGRAVIETAHADLLRLHGRGDIKPEISRTVDLESVPAALEALEARQIHGRCVMICS